MNAQHFVCVREQVSTNDGNEETAMASSSKAHKQNKNGKNRRRMKENGSFSFYGPVDYYIFIHYYYSPFDSGTVA